MELPPVHPQHLHTAVSMSHHVDSLHQQQQQQQHQNNSMMHHTMTGEEPKKKRKCTSKVSTVFFDRLITI
jgi:hypothetical protein